MGSSISTARIQTLGAAGWAPVGSGAGALSLPVLTTANNATFSQTITTTDLVVGAPQANGSTVSGASTAFSYAAIALRGSDVTWTVGITGLTSGTLYFEGTMDGTNWLSLFAVRLGVTSSVYLPVNAATINGVYQVTVGGYSQVRLRSVGALSGTPALASSLSPAAAPVILSPGANPIGFVSIGGAGGMGSTSGALTASQAYNTSTSSSTSQLVAAVASAGNLTFHVAATAFVGTLIFEASVDNGGNWAPVISNREDGTGAETGAVLSIAALFVRQYTLALPGYTHFRVRCSAFTSGSAGIYMQPGPFLVETNPSLSAGSATIGAVNLVAGVGGATAGFRPDGELRVAMDATTLLLDTFEVLDTVNTWTLSGSVVPTQAAGALTVSAGTVASAQSAIRSQPAFTNGATAFTNYTSAWVIDAAAVTGNKRVWGLGIPNATPTVAVPITNGVVFEVQDTDGSMVGAAYSNGVRTATVPIVRPTDGAPHRYNIFFRASRVYFEVDSVTAYSIAYPNPQVDALPAVAVSVNASSGQPGTAATLVAAVVGVADTGRNSTQVSDGLFPWRKASVSPGSHLKVAPYSTTPGQTSPGLTTASAPVLAANANRIGAAMTNDPASVSSVYLLLGATASVTAYTVIVAPGGYYEVPFGYAGVIAGICSTGTATMRVTELTP